MLNSPLSQALLTTAVRLLSNDEFEARQDIDAEEYRDRLGIATAVYTSVQEMQHQAFVKQVPAER